MWLREQIETIKQRDPAATSSLEVLLTYPGLHALIFHRASSAMRKRDMRVAARLISHVGRFLTGIEIHPGAVIGRRLFIDHGMGVVIGETAIVGDDVTMYQGVTLGGTGKQRGKRHPTVGNGVVIGAGAKILGAVTIGDGAKIGGGAVVLKDVPPYTTAVGVPARAVAWTNPESGVSRRLEQLPDPQYDSMLAMIQRIEEQEDRIRALTAEVEEKESTLAGSWQI
ncbi:MAG TPA: serine O-acetyltransferase EpsC [Thermomicrobiales bacterium]|jgi:serine O-acetyltransferase|nr:serine O-acetyltransferase EpsC [Thermomicrobiales bacterium]